MGSARHDEAYPYRRHASSSRTKRPLVGLAEVSHPGLRNDTPSFDSWQAIGYRKPIWIPNGTGDSLPISVLLHAATTLPLTAVYAPLQKHVLPALWTFNAMLAFVAVSLIARTG